MGGRDWAAWASVTSGRGLLAAGEKEENESGGDWIWSGSWDSFPGSVLADAELIAGTQ